MSAGSGDALKFSGNERGAVFNGRGSWRGRISEALIQGVHSCDHMFYIYVKAVRKKDRMGKKILIAVKTKSGR